MGEGRIIEIDPGFVEDEQGRTTVEPGFQAVDEIAQHRQDKAGRVHQGFGLETQDVGEGQPVFGGVEQSSERTFQRPRRERRFQRLRLQQDGQPCQRPLFRRRAGKARQRRPEHFLQLGRHDQFLMAEKFGDPVGGPRAFSVVVDVAERLEGQRVPLPERDMVAAHRQRRRPRRQPLIEDVDLRSGVAAKL
ncbi:hypothetical protein D3C73_1175540 [compost metagenome]